MNRFNARRRQLSRLETRLADMTRQDDGFSNIRLWLVVGIFPVSLIALFAISPGAFAGVFSGLIIIFFIVVAIHHRLRQRIEAHQGWLGIKQEELARLTLDWEGIPETSPVTPAEHPFAHDLNLPRLHRLLNTAATKQGQARLYNWLLSSHPDADAIAYRQKLVRELIPKSIFRTRLLLNSRLPGEDLHHLIDGDRLLNWINTRSAPSRLRLMTSITAGLAVLNLLFLSGWIADMLPPLWIISWVVYGIVFATQRRLAGDIFKQATDLLNSLDILGAVMVYLERYNYAPGSALGELCAPVVEQAPSRHIRRLSWIASGASLQGNLYLWFVVNALLPWDLIVAVRLHREAARLGEHLPQWLAVWYELEALSSLATFAALNPDYTFPHMGQDVFYGEGIGHPLIPSTQKVRNDFSFDRLGEIRIVTGSNMSGKSTFLRTLGVNLVLAYAGSVVDAHGLEVRLFRIFTSIQISDSLEDGISYFYAEVKRLRALLDALQNDDALPLFFLIDEIFRGTNNRERLIGSRTYVQALAGGHGVGLIATHDLELTTLADIHAGIANMHFQELIEDGRMHFDYTLRSGPCATTNALHIMRLEGLPVDDPPT